MYGVSGRYLLDVKVDEVTYPVGEGRLAKIRVHECLGYAAPMAELFIDDRMHFLMEIVGLTGTEVFNIGVGDSAENIEYHKFRLFRSVALKHGADSMLIKLYLISYDAAPLFTPARYKSYPGSTISDVVRAIAAELGLKAKVEDTVGEFDLFCPGWTYAQFLTWLGDRARSSSHGTCGFVHFVDLDSTLHFYSTEYAKTSKDVVNVLPLNPLDADSYDENDIEGGPFRVYQNPMLMGGQGAWGVTAAYFDFMNGRFVEGPQTVDGSRGSRLSLASPGYTSFERGSTVSTKMKDTADNLSILSYQTDGQNVIEGDGVASDESNITLSEARRESKIVRAANTMNRQEFLVTGDLRIRAGSMIMVHLRSPIAGNAVNQVHSGRWLVDRVMHQLVPQYLTKVFAFRAGVSGSDKGGLLRPPGGVV